MHGREDVHPSGREHARDLLDHTRRVGHEDERVMVIDEVELAPLEPREVAHVALHQSELRAALLRERAHRRELFRREIEERCLGTELGEEDRIPSAATRQGQHALSSQRDVLDAPEGELVEETPLRACVARRRALRSRVWDACGRQAIPHALVVLGDGVHGHAPSGRAGGASCHGATIAAACARATYARRLRG